ncbi:hypothetical protein [Bacillus cereus group sp. MYBK14-1]|uniref:hypothetical protein n=1 Tax=Bacillus cereus group sp. MYBK14-1 TaxID=3450682 RepID=UPI003F7930F9
MGDILNLRLKISENIWRNYNIYNHEILKPYFWGIANEDPFKEGGFEELKQIRLMSDKELEGKLEDDTEN